jgi:hypothetical protein
MKPGVAGRMQPMFRCEGGNRKIESLPLFKKRSREKGEKGGGGYDLSATGNSYRHSPISGNTAFSRSNKNVKHRDVL